ncbi:MAG: hypothetical protein Q8P67_12955 [archaeon]|nr:hypothetical protein [archaeon]
MVLNNRLGGHWMFLKYSAADRCCSACSFLLSAAEPLDLLACRSR